MDSDGTGSPAEWKQFLNLGEELLRQPHSLALKKKLLQILSRELKCEADMWLMEPFYPLPGEPYVETLPNENHNKLLKKVLSDQKIAVFPEQEGKIHSASEIAVPVITRGNMLAVLYIKRNENDPFTIDEINRIEGIAAYAAVSMQVNRQVALKNWHYDQISLVRSVSSQITNVLDLDELGKQVTNLIQCSFNFYHVALFTLEDGANELLFRASSLECAPNVENPLFSVHYGEGLIGEVAQTGKEIIAKDVTKEPKFRYLEALPKTKAEAVLPLKIENRILGVLDIQTDRLPAFHENDMLVLRSLADNIALAVESARLFNDLKRKADHLSAIAEVNIALSSILDTDDLLQEVVGLIHERFMIPFVNIYTVHGGRQKVIFQAGRGMRTKNLKANSFAYNLHDQKGIIPYVARTGKSMLVNDVSKEPLFKPSRVSPEETKSELSIPLTFGENVLGVLDLQSDVLNNFNQSDLDMFEGLASGVAVSMRNANLFRTERWRRQVADSFKDVAGLLSSELALDDLLDKILVELEQILPCDASAIWLMDDPTDVTEDQRPLKLAAVSGTSRQKVISAHSASIEVRKFLELGIFSKQPVIRKPTDPYGPLGAALNFKSKYSSLAVPLLSGDTVIGVLTLAHQAEGRYGSEASAIATTFANYSAVAIQNARLYTKAQEDAWSSTVLLQVAEAMQTISTYKELFSTMVRLTPLLVGINQCAFFVRNQSNQTFELKSWYGFDPGEEELTLSENDSLGLLKLRATLEPVFITSPSEELGLKSISIAETNGTMVLLPLISHEEILGAFFISHTSSGEFGFRNLFTDQTLAILLGIAQQISIGMENIQLLENRQEEAYITAVLLQVAQAVVSQNELDDILNTIVHLVPILVGVDTCVIYLWDEEKSRYYARNAVASSHNEIDELLKSSYGVGEFALLDNLIETGQMVSCPLDTPDFNISDWNKLSCVPVEDMSNSKAENWLIGFPLIVRGEKYGALFAKEINVINSFHNKRLELMKGVAQQTTLAIQNEHIKTELVNRERMEREFQLAREIQETFLPETLPKPEGWDIDLRWQTAREVGGDFYDIFTTRNNKIAFAIADVADKGMPAALYMTVTRTLIRASAQSIQSPGKVLERVNELLEMDSRNGMFVTAFFGILDSKTGIFEYANAGHNLPLFFKNKSGTIERLQKGAIALGVLPDIKYDDSQITLNYNDTLLLYTDGVTEAFSTSGELFNESRLVEALNKNHCDSADELLSSIEKLITEFRSGEPASDDLTMIAIHRSEKKTL